ncbi:MAG: metal-dependent hydrolase [Desulfurococcaceae archaeon]
MKRITHVVFAAALTAALNLWTIKGGALYTFIAIASSIAPDVDLGKYHRKLLHNIFAWMFLVVFLQITAPYLGLEGYYVFVSVTIGWLSHIFLDSLTKKGVALLYPFSRKFYGLRIFSGDNLAVNVLFIILSLLVLIRYAFTLITALISS